MKELVAEISIDSIRNTMKIYKHSDKWSVENYKGEVHCYRCNSFDKAVKYACEYLGLIFYKPVFEKLES